MIHTRTSRHTQDRAAPLKGIHLAYSSRLRSRCPTLVAVAGHAPPATVQVLVPRGVSPSSEGSMLTEG